MNVVTVFDMTPLGEDMDLIWMGVYEGKGAIFVHTVPNHCLD